MNKAEEDLALDNIKMLTNIIAQQTTTLNALTKVSEVLIEKVTKLEISEAIRQTLKAQTNE
tara:strand:- start:1507 stop:1689 length:183 start_codon:yes stop_codon:yes gene_type:complete